MRRPFFFLNVGLVWDDNTFETTEDKTFVNSSNLFNVSCPCLHYPLLWLFYFPTLFSVPFLCEKGFPIKKQIWWICLLLFMMWSLPNNAFYLYLCLCLHHRSTCNPLCMSIDTVIPQVSQLRMVHNLDDHNCLEIESHISVFLGEHHVYRSTLTPTSLQR